MSKTKPYIISKQLVMEAYQRVKGNKGAAGVDQQSLEDFGQNLKDNLYKIWNRMSSGTYFPPPVKAVPIKKKQGGERILGVPTVSDRIAQMVVKLTFEPLVDPLFHKDSYGYRPNKSALDAIGVTRQRCWRYDYLVEFDIKGLFDNLDHTLLMKAVKKHTDNKWVILYMERWLKAPLQMPDGTLIERTKGLDKEMSLAPFSVIYFFIMFLMCGWKNSTLGNHGAVMLMMVWYTAEQRKRLSKYWLTLNNVLKRVVLSFIQGKQRLSTAKTPIGKEATQIQNLRFWVMTSNEGGQEILNKTRYS